MLRGHGGQTRFKDLGFRTAGCALHATWVLGVNSCHWLLVTGSWPEARSEKPVAKTFRRHIGSLNRTQLEVILYIEYKCTGGYGGLRFAYQGETDALPAAEAKKILDLIDAAGALEMDPKQISANSRNIPDDFVCRLTLSTGQINKTLSFNELSAPENLRRLSAHLRKLAAQQQGAH